MLGFDKFKNQTADARCKRRRRIVDQIARDMRLADLQTRFNVTLLGAVARFDETQIERILSSTRTRLHRKLAQKLPLTLLYIYRDEGMNKLKRYADVQHRSAMLWVNVALVRFVGGALGAVARSIPETFKTKDQ